MSIRKLLTQITADLSTVRRAYEKAGLLEDEAPNSAAFKLLGGGEDSKRFRRDFLLLDATVRERALWLGVDAGSLRHAAVFGGNNVGKSTVVNILAATAVTSTSPRGGHTQSPLAVAATTGPLFGDNIYAFRDFTEVSVQELSRNRFDCYGRTLLVSTVLPREVVLWDTPDCDAAGSGRYLAGVIEAVAAVDLVIYVTSVERYAVEMICEWVFLLHEMGIPIIECINKTPLRARQEIIDDQRDRIFPEISKNLRLPAPMPEIVALKYLQEGEESDLWGSEHPEAADLRDTTLTILARGDRKASGRAALDYAMRNIARALEPAAMEQEAQRIWSTEVTRAVAEFVTIYEQSYLGSAAVIEPFSRLNLAILQELDPNIPGLKEAMSAIRWVTRWPSRLLIRAGRRIISTVFSNGVTPTKEKLAPELQAYTEAHQTLLNRLNDVIDKEQSAPRHHPFWESLADAWLDELDRLKTEFGEAISEHMKRTDAEIKSAAADIFAKLKERPAMLNALKGARVAANVGGALVGFIVPIKGGIVYDLLEEAVIAPALMTATEAATAATVETYVTRRKDLLIDKLKRDARNIAQTLYYDPLSAVADKAMARAGLIGVDQEILDRLPANLQRVRTQLADRERPRGAA
jgi:50S ribosome-binding GTPase